MKACDEFWSHDDGATRGPICDDCDRHWDEHSEEARLRQEKPKQAWAVPYIGECATCTKVADRTRRKRNA